MPASSARQQAASTTNDGQAKRMAFWVTQRTLTPVVSPRRTAPVAGGELGCGITPKNELDARLRCTTDALDKAVCVRTTKLKRRARY